MKRRSLFRFIGAGLGSLLVPSFMRGHSKSRRVPLKFQKTEEHFLGWADRRQAVEDIANELRENFHLHRVMLFDVAGNCIFPLYPNNYVDTRHAVFVCFAPQGSGKDFDGGPMPLPPNILKGKLGSIVVAVAITMDDSPSKISCIIREAIQRINDESNFPYQVWTGV